MILTNYRDVRVFLLWRNWLHASRLEREARAVGEFDKATEHNDRTCHLERKMFKILDESI